MANENPAQGRGSGYAGYGRLPGEPPTIAPPGSNLPIRRLLAEAEERSKDLLDVITNQLEPRLAAFSACRPAEDAGGPRAKEGHPGVSEQAQTLTRINVSLEIAIERLHAYIAALEV